MAQENPSVTDRLETAREDPDAVDVATVLDSLDVDDGTTRTLTLRTLAHLARERPEEVAEYGERVRAALDDEFPVAESAAALVCMELAPDHPDVVRPAVPRLVDMLDEVPPRKGYRAARTLIPVLESDPGAFVPVADELIDVLADPPEVETPAPEELKELPDAERKHRVETLKSQRDQITQDLSRTYGIQEFAAHALVEVADADPDALVDRVDDIRAGLAAEVSTVRAATADALATLARADPAAIDPAVDDLIGVLGADTSAVQAFAVQALGHAGATEAVDPLRELATDENVDDELTELAADTADFLSN